MVNNDTPRAAFVVIGFLAGILLFGEACRYPGTWHARGGDVNRSAALRGAIFGLSFSGAAKRFETWIARVVEWTGATRTALPRIDLLAAETQAPRELCSALVSMRNQRSARRSQA